MASSAQVKELLGLLAGMFKGTPGKQILAEFTGYLDKGTSMTALAEALSKVGEFQVNNLYPARLNNAQFADVFLSQYGLQNNQIARDFVIGREITGSNRGVTILEGIRALLAVQDNDPVFAPAKKILENQIAVSQHFSVTRDIASSDLGTLQSVLAGVGNGPFDVGIATTRTDELFAQSGGKKFVLTTASDAFNTTNTDLNLRPTALSDLFDASNPRTLNSTDTLNGGAGFDRLVVAAEELDGFETVTLAPTLGLIEGIRFKVLSTVNGALTANKVTLDLANATGVESVFMSVQNGTHGELTNLNLTTPLAITDGGERVDTQVTLAYRGNLSGTSDRLFANIGENGRLTVLESLNVLNIENANFTLTGAVVNNVVTGGEVRIANFNNDVTSAQQSQNTLRNVVFGGTGNLVLGRETDANKLSFSGLGVVNTASVDARSLRGDVTVFLGDQVTRFAVEAGQGELDVFNKGSTTTTAPANSAISVIAGTGILTAELGATAFMEVRGSAGDDFLDMSTFTGGDTAAPAGTNNGGILGGISGLLNPTPAPTSGPATPAVPQNADVQLGAGNDYIKLRAGTVNVNTGEGDDRLEILNLDQAGILTNADSINGGAGRDVLISNALSFTNLVATDPATGNLVERVVAVEALEATGTGTINIDAGAISREIREFIVINNNTGVNFTNLINTDSIEIRSFQINKLADGTAGNLTFASAASPASSIGNLKVTFEGATRIPPNVNTEVDGEQGVIVAGFGGFTGFKTIELTSRDGNLDNMPTTAPIHRFLGGAQFNNSTDPINVALKGRGTFDLGAITNTNSLTITAAELDGVLRIDLTDADLNFPLNVTGTSGDDSFRVGAEPRPNNGPSSSNDRTVINASGGMNDKILIAGNYSPIDDASLEGVEIVEFDQLQNQITRVNLSSQTGESFIVRGTTLMRGEAIANTNPAQTRGMDLIMADGADTITGSRFNDTIEAGAGNDNITGGNGADTFVFASSATGNGTDTITDFIVGTGNDVLNLSAFGIDGNTGAQVPVLGAVQTAAPAAASNVNGTIVRLVDIAGGQNITTAAGLTTAVAINGEYANINMTASSKAIFITSATNGADADFVFYAESNSEGTITATLVGTLTNAVDIDNYVAGNFLI